MVKYIYLFNCMGIYIFPCLNRAGDEFDGADSGAAVHAGGASPHLQPSQNRHRHVRVTVNLNKKIACMKK